VKTFDDHIFYQRSGMNASYRARVMRYWLKGDKKGDVETFLGGLPFFPDNVRFNELDGNFYIGFAGVSIANLATLMHSFFPIHFLRLHFESKKSAWIIWHLRVSVVFGSLHFLFFHTGWSLI
jgi:hypothetical protein